MRAELDSWREDIEGNCMLVSFFAVPVIVVLPVMLVLGPLLEPYIGPAGDWLQSGAHPVGKVIAIIMVIVMVVGIIAVPAWLVPLGIEKWWQRHYRLTRRMLAEHDLALLVIGDIAVERIYTVLARQRWLKPTASQRPRSVVERVEFCSDYWRALFAIARGYRGRLDRLVMLGNLVRLQDDSISWLFNGCTVIIIMAASGPFIILLIPLWIAALMSSIQQQAAQYALADYFIEQEA
jgi:hypothetical protein